jgi:hypothetical protein|tara:strand:+ start:91 stop:1074 length:984 start_codon:yes stop_codon:yes gene_type:complete
MPKQKRKKPASDEEGEEVEIIPLPPYRNEGKKIPWKKMAVTLKTIFDYEGIKAPDVNAYVGKKVVVLYYVFHLVKFNSIFRKNKMKEANTWVITEALRSCGIMDDNDDVATFPSIPSLMLDNIFGLVENGEESVVAEFSQVFNTDSDVSGEWLFKQIDWNYLKDSVDFEGFTVAVEGDDISDYNITLDAATIFIFASNSHDPQVKVKRKSPKVGDITDHTSWDKANYCEVCKFGIKSQFAFITPGKIGGVFKVKATSGSITQLIIQDETSDDSKNLRDKVQKAKFKGDAANWAVEINRYMARHWWKCHSETGMNPPEWALPLPKGRK